MLRLFISIIIHFVMVHLMSSMPKGTELGLNPLDGTFLLSATSWKADRHEPYMQKLSMAQAASRHGPLLAKTQSYARDFASM